MIGFVSQVAVLAGWSAFGIGAFGMRLIKSLTLLVAALCGFEIGRQVVLPHPFFSNHAIVPQNMISYLFIYFGVHLIVYGIMRRIKGWRIRSKHVSSVANESLQFSIRDMLLWTAIVAFLLMVGKWLLRNEPRGGIHTWLMWETNVQLYMAFMFSIVTLPVINWALSTKPMWREESVSQFFSSLIYISVCEWIFWWIALKSYVYVTGRTEFSPHVFEITVSVIVINLLAALIATLVALGLWNAGFYLVEPGDNDSPRPHEK